MLVQVGLLAAVKDLVFHPTVAVLFGDALCERHGSARLQEAFFAFEAGFELAASPVPHWMQRGSAGRGRPCWPPSSEPIEVLTRPCRQIPCTCTLDW